MHELLRILDGKVVVIDVWRMENNFVYEMIPFREGVKAE